MLYHLFYPLTKIFSGFNVFKYLTFRSAGAVITALVVSFLLGPWMIRRLRALKFGQRCVMTGRRPIWPSRAPPPWEAC